MNKISISKIFSRPPFGGNTIELIVRKITLYEERAMENWDKILVSQSIIVI